MRGDRAAEWEIGPMFRKVSHLLRRKRGDLGRRGSRLHLDDGQEVEESKASLRTYW